MCKVNRQVTYPLSVKTSVHLWMWLKMKRVGYTGGKARLSKMESKQTVKKHNLWSVNTKNTENTHIDDKEYLAQIFYGRHRVKVL